MRNQIFAFLISLIPPYVAATTGVFFKPGIWYQGLLKPTWTPPPIAFPIVWTILYFFMGITFYFLYRSQKLKKREGFIYCLALIFNALWSPLFFGAHWLWVSLFVIGGLWVAIATFIFLLRKVKAIAILNFFYLIWLSIAFSLNLSIALSNGPVENPEAYLDEQFEKYLTDQPRAAFKEMSARTVSLKTQDGYHRLKKEELYRWNQLRLKMAEANLKLCSSLWLGGVENEDMYSSFKGFYPGDLNDWARLSAKAFEAGWKLEASKAYPETEMQKILFDISLTLNKKEKARFFEALRQVDRVNPREACWMLKKTLKWIEENRNLESEKLLYFFAKKLSS